MDYEELGFQIVDDMELTLIQQEALEAILD